MTDTTTTGPTTTGPITITEVHARPILDSRGFPTVEVDLVLEVGSRVRAAAPSGASTGEHEALELRDGGDRFGGKGVDHAVANVRGEISGLLTARPWDDLAAIDGALAAADGTGSWSRLGANAVVAVSMAAARAFAHAAGQELHTWIAQTTGSAERLPVPHFNVLNGGAHAANDLDLQEFMIAPVGASNEEDAVATGAEVYHALRAKVVRAFGSAGLGDEGGFAPALADPREALDLLVEAIGDAGFTPGADPAPGQVAIALDPAANGFFLGDGRYRIAGREYDHESLTAYYLDLIADYPIRSLEDGFAEDDTAGWEVFARAADGRVQIVGDDLYVTDPERIRRGAEHGWSDAVLIKVNQIGSVSQTFEAIRTARELDMACMVSHRSGETTDDFIADLVVGTGVGQIKSGAPARGERVAKYNRLTEIALGDPTLPYGLL